MKSTRNLRLRLRVMECALLFGLGVLTTAAVSTHELLLDAANHPTSFLDLGDSHVVGTLDAARLPTAPAARTLADGVGYTAADAATYQLRAHQAAAVASVQIIGTTSLADGGWVSIPDAGGTPHVYERQVSAAPIRGATVFTGSTGADLAGAINASGFFSAVSHGFTVTVSQLAAGAAPDGLALQAGGGAPFDSFGNDGETFSGGTDAADLVMLNWSAGRFVTFQDAGIACGNGRFQVNLDGSVTMPSFQVAAVNGIPNFSVDGNGGVEIGSSGLESVGDLVGDGNVLAGGAAVGTGDGYLATGNQAYAPGAVIPTGYLLIKDATGTAYRIPAVADGGE